jgi:hypothetical protein
MMTLLANLIINSETTAKSCNYLPDQNDKCSATRSTMLIGTYERVIYSIVNQESDG